MKAKKIKEAGVEVLYRHCDPSQFNFETTAEITDLTDFVGQPRAQSAIEFGARMPSEGFNIFAMGPKGTGKHSMIKKILDEIKKSPPSDWCYIYNFSDPEKPTALELPKGYGKKIKKSMRQFVVSVMATLPTFFVAEEYLEQIQKIIDLPLEPHEKNQLEKTIQKELAFSIIKPQIDKLKLLYNDFPLLVKYLDAVQHDMINHANDLLNPDAQSGPLFNNILTRYKVNLFVDHSLTESAPILYESKPTVENLIGEIEQIAQLGTLTTHFTLIKPGSLHRANGGFLLIDMDHITHEPYAWETLKRMLYAKAVTIESSRPSLGSFHTVGLKPEPIALDIKIILIGERTSYYWYQETDSDFNELFKVSADFEEDFPRNNENMQIYAELVATIARKDHLRPFDRNAVSRLIEHSSRLADDSEKLTMHMRSIADVMQEADYLANAQNHSTVTASDVQDAINNQYYRHGRVRERMLEDIFRHFILIDTKDQIIGQINGLSVIHISDIRFGYASRITATTRVGKGEIIDIEREVDLGGALHSKGVLILSGFIGGRYLTNQNLSLSASLVFEQTYGTVEGDSASVAELVVILSSLAHLPIKQSIAVTGSINQLGQVQAIGGVNEKIEGFFEICKYQGLTGKQGVIIPAVNTKHLMLHEEVVTAVKNQQFHIYPIKTIDEALTILTGVEAGEKDDKNHFPKDSVNYLVEEKLRKYTEHEHPSSEESASHT